MGKRFSGSAIDRKIELIIDRQVKLIHL